MRGEMCLSALAILAVLATAGSTAAQVCAGLPAESDGSASYGVMGTDGASGQRFDLTARYDRAGLRIAYSRLDMFATSDDMDSWIGHVTWALGEMASWGCFLAGAEWTGYSADLHRATSREVESNRRIEEHLTVGEYDRVRFPIGFSVGKEISPDGSFSALPFASAALVIERETLSPPSGLDESRTRLAPGVQGGMTLRFHRLILRSDLGHVFTEDSALSGRHNFAVASLSLGLIF